MINPCFLFLSTFWLRWEAAFLGVAIPDMHISSFQDQVGSSDQIRDNHHEVNMQRMNATVWYKEQKGK
jgi:hypothetical protein